MISDKSCRCRVCGYATSEPPWGEDGSSPQFDFCSCCGVEHGYQDCTQIGARRFREAWIKSGAAWEDKGEKPPGWNLENQLSQIPKAFL